MLYVGNILTNLLLVNKFLETDEYSVYGIGVLKDLLTGKSWMASFNCCDCESNWANYRNLATFQE